MSRFPGIAVLFSAGNVKISFLFIAVLFSAGNVKKNVFTVFTVPIVTIDAFVVDVFTITT